MVLRVLPYGLTIGVGADRRGRQYLEGLDPDEEIHLGNQVLRDDHDPGLHLTTGLAGIGWRRLQVGRLTRGARSRISRFELSFTIVDAISCFTSLRLVSSSQVLRRIALSVGTYQQL